MTDVRPQLNCCGNSTSLQLSCLLCLVDPVHLKLQEGTQFKLEFTEPAPKGMKYKEIGWMKGNSDSKSKIVFFHQEMTKHET